MLIPYLDLSVKDPALKAQLLEAVDRVLTHGRVVLGPEVEEFESRLADFCGRGFAVGVSSGTDALYLALRASGIGEGDEVITTPLSWISTVNAITMVGAKPIFVDIEPDLNISPELIVDAITTRTKAIIPVHFNGKVCKMDSIIRIADKYGILVIEDAAQAFGASLNGKKAGSFGHIACFSMNSMKVLHSYGEAGIILTDEPLIREKLEYLRYAGTVDRENCVFPSLNFRIQTLQAALLLVELNRVDNIIEHRRRIAQKYLLGLQDLVECPREDIDSIHVFYTYTIQCDRRDELKAHLQQLSIETKIHHSILMPYHDAYKDKLKPHIPQADKLHKRILSIPNHEKMEDSAVDIVINRIREFF